MPVPAGLALAVHRLPADDPSRPLRLRYVGEGDRATVRWPPALATGEEPRRDGLWRHTCFEAFVAAPAGHGSGYVEYNFAPLGAWAIYRFDGYRQGMRPESAPVAPRIVVTRTAAGTTAIDVAVAWPSAVATEIAGVRLGLSAVLEAADGSLSYWALHHPSARPDFHNDAGFQLELEVPA